MSSPDEAPAGWVTATIGDICEVVGGHPAPKEPHAFVSDGVPFVRMKDLGAYHHTTDLTEVADTLSPGYVVQSGFRVLPRGAILLPRSGSVALNHRAILGVDAVIVSHICALVVRDKRVLNKFLYYILTRTRMDHITKKTTGLDAITFEDLRTIPVSFPPLPEQRRIAAILDKADAIRRKRRETIRLTDDFLRSVFLDMFGDPVSNPKGWNSGHIDDVVRNPRTDVRCGPFGTQLKVAELVDEGTPLWGIENVRENKFLPVCTKYLTRGKADELDCFDALPGDVLVTRMGTIGKSCVVPEDAGEGRISYHLFRIRVDKRKCLPDFLASTIARSGIFQHQLELRAHGAIMAGLSTTDLRDIAFLVPPLTEQERYVRIVTATDRLMARLRHGECEADSLMLALSQRAFKGDL